MPGARILQDHSPEATLAFLREELGHSLVQVAARCDIDYQGRAESRLEPGQRIILLKPDGTLLVHTAEKLKPVNWQPPGCAFAAEIAEGRVVVTATREKPREIVRISLHEVLAVLALDLVDEEALDLVGSEDDLQAFLAKRPDVIEPGFRFRERERASGRGPMDLYGEDAEGRRVVVEVKRRAAGVAEADQLRRYVERERGARIGVPVRGILVAPSVSEKARKYLADLELEYREVDWEKLRKPAAEMLKSKAQRTLGSF